MARSLARKPFFAVFALVAACSGTPDPRTVEGALGYAARAVESDDGRMLFRVIDARSRHAMISIVADRKKAADAIRRSYPEAQKASALASLGDAAEATDAADLFAHRCDAACRAEIGASLAAPTRLEARGTEIVAHTAKGTMLTLYRKHEGDWYGLVWKTDELVRERDRANRDRHAIEENAAIYDRRRALETAAPTPP